MNSKFLELQAFIHERQSLFTSQMKMGAKIPDSKINALLELANHAPSHRRTQPWRFVVFKQQSLQEMYNELANIYAATTPKEKFDQRKMTKLIERPNYLSHAVAICMHRDPQERVPVFEEEYSVACAVQNILLGMKPLEIIGYWSSPKLCYTDDFKNFLHLTEEDKCMGIIQLGVKKEGLPEIPKISNSPIEDKVVWR